MVDQFDFSVLLSVYVRESPVYLDDALKSIWNDQVLKPSQIVLVQDGPLNASLESVIFKWSLLLNDTLTLVVLDNNLGLAAALNEGLKHCKYEMVARMDTDDLAAPDRFEKQARFMNDNPDIAVSSGYIEEWNQDFSRKISERYLPLDHESIYKFAKIRSPISHPAVIFRRSAVLDAGGYPNIYPEDYPLWGGMLAKGYKFANLPDILLKMRVGDALVARRGKDFLKGEVKVFKYFYSIGFISIYELIRNISMRSFLRLSPLWLKKILYKYFR